MKLLISLAVAFAAGTISFAASAQPAPPMKKQYLFPAPTVEAAKPGKDKVATGKTKAGEKRTVRAGKGKRVSYKKRIQRKKAHRQRILLDTMATAGIPAVLPVGPDDRPVSPAKRYDGFVAQYAASNGVPVSLAHAVISVESNYRPNTLGRAGEVGLMQIKPATARMMGYQGSLRGLYDPETNIKYGMKYLGMAHKLGGGATCATILKYNAGHAARRMNPVSSAYCGKVMRQLGG